MQGIKYTINITVEVLSKDSALSLLCEVASVMADECSAGSIIKDDGDTVFWNTLITPFTI